MTILDFFLQCMSQNYSSVMRSVGGLTYEELCWQPNFQSMSIGFIFWHYGRVLDMWPSRIDNTSQIWESQWAKEFGRAPDPMETGFGFTAEQISAFEVPGSHTLFGYTEASFSKAKKWVGSQKANGLDEIVTHTRDGKAITLINLFQQLLWELNQHGGQISYLRGCQRGIETPKYSGPVLEAVIHGN